VGPGPRTALQEGLVTISSDAPRLRHVSSERTASDEPDTDEGWRDAEQFWGGE
jgi:hypothetical protein